MISAIGQLIAAGKLITATAGAGWMLASSTFLRACQVVPIVQPSRSRWLGFRYDAMKRTFDVRQSSPGSLSNRSAGWHSMPQRMAVRSDSIWLSEIGKGLQLL